MNRYNEVYRAKCETVEAFLEQLYKDTSGNQTLYQAMRYSLLAGGKRIRPILCLGFAEAVGGESKRVLPAACAIELVHTYSLIHDDLPCMDNDDYRRGKLTCHKVFGENMATLAGDALLTNAFSLVTEVDAEPEKIVEAVRILSQAAGEKGMVSGQVFDLQGEGKYLSEEELRCIHTHKTGDMIYAACAIGVVLGGGNKRQLDAAREFAYALGLAFQIRDDILDEVGDAGVLGKPIGSDCSNDKFTYCSLFGVEKCQQLVEEETQRAITALEKGDFLHISFLKELAEQLVRRNR